MTILTWEFGAVSSGLHFKISYDTSTGGFTVTSLEGSFDLNALWWNDGVDDGSSVRLAKSDSSLNMNGSGEDWDGYAKLSNAGLGPEGADKSTFISAGESQTFLPSQLAIYGEFNPAEGGTLGVRATSVNGEGSIKYVDTEPESHDHFPDVPSASEFVFYFDTPDGDISAVRFVDNTGSELSTDLDDWYDDALAFVLDTHPDWTVSGTSIEGTWYDIDNDPNDMDVPPPSLPDTYDTYSVISANPFEVEMPPPL